MNWNTGGRTSRSGGSLSGLFSGVTVLAPCRHRDVLLSDNEISRSQWPPSAVQTRSR